MLLGWAIVSIVRVGSAYNWGNWDVDLGVTGEANVWDLFSSTLLTPGGPLDEVDFLYSYEIASPLLWLTVAVGLFAALAIANPVRFGRFTAFLALVHVGSGVVLHLGGAEAVTFAVLQAAVPAICAMLLLTARPIGSGRTPAA